jgi:aryl-alcohol dehydrogenase-like predicted oxidoreductase
MQAPRDLPRLTDRLRLGNSGLEVSPICVGIVGDPETIPAAFEAGINFFFVTADMHWPLYEPTRRGLLQLLETNRAARSSVVVGVVSYVTQPVFMWAPFSEVLEELPILERIDLTIAGGNYRPEFDVRERVLESHREVGHVGARAVGASFHDRSIARECLDRDRLDIAYIRYNPVHAGAREDLFPHVRPRAAGRRCLLYNFKSTYGHLAEDDYAPLGVPAHFWRPHPTDYYRFALTEPALDGILCAPSSPGEVRELADALARGPLDAEECQYLRDLGELARGAARVAATDA